MLNGVEVEEWVERAPLTALSELRALSNTKKFCTFMLLCNEFTDVRTNSGALLQKQFLVNTFCIES